MGAMDLTEDLDKAPEISKYLSRSAIGMSRLDYDDFVQKNYFSGGKVYIDKKRFTYHVMEYGRKGCSSCWGLCDCSICIGEYKEKKKGIKGNYKGDGFQLGGTIITDRNGDVIYSYKQRAYNDLANVKGMIAAVEMYVAKYNLNDENKNENNGKIEIDNERGVMKPEA